MILKGSQRSNGADLAVHLANGFDNERVEVAEVYGTVAGDLLGAFSEFEAIARGTRCKDYLYSLSINPPAPLSRDQYHAAIADIEHELGLAGQPRAVVFHSKDGREHCHVVWSRIDVQAMKAISLSFDHSKLMNVAVKLADRYDLALPPGLKAWKRKNVEERRRLQDETLEPTLAENQQSKKTAITAEQGRDQITALYVRADSGAAFRAALEQSGYVLAKGDKRGFVIVDSHGDVHSLSRNIKGHSAKNIRKKLGNSIPAQLPDVEQARAMVHGRKTDVDERAARDDQLEAEIRATAEAQLKETQQARQTELAGKEQELLTRQASERMALHAAQATEAKSLMFKVKNAVANLIARSPMLRSVLGPMQKRVDLDPAARHELEWQALAKRHEFELADIAREKRFLAAIEKREAASLEISVKRQLAAQIKLRGKAKDEFARAAHDPFSRAKAKEGKGKLTDNFNQQNPKPAKRKKAEDGSSGKAKWKARAEKSGQSQDAKESKKRKRSRGYSYRRPRIDDIDPGSKT